MNLVGTDPYGGESNKRTEMAVNRRIFVKSAGWSALAAVGGAAGWFGAGLVEYMGAAPDTPWKALAPQEAETLDRLAEELIPADPPSPGFCGDRPFRDENFGRI